MINILELKMNNGKTIGQFFIDCMIELIREGESFSGKRPLGASIWYFEIKQCLIDNDIITSQTPIWDIDNLLVSALEANMRYK